MVGRIFYFPERAAKLRRRLFRKAFVRKIWKLSFWQFQKGKWARGLRGGTSNKKFTRFFPSFLQEATVWETVRI
jgi:hypothetical protein